MSFDRESRDWAGISPERFMGYLTLTYAKNALKESRCLMDAALDAGLSGTERLSDRFVTFETMTPGEFKKRAAGVTVTYGFGSTPFGECLLAETERGICSLGFVGPGGREDATADLFHSWPGAVFGEDSESAAAKLDRIFRRDGPDRGRPFHLHLKGTDFQIKVWRALLTIPEGHLVSYQDVAALTGNIKATRAAAGAVARNPVAFLIPCHRVISQSGRFNRYRWGSARKRALIGWEAARRG